MILSVVKYTIRRFKEKADWRDLVKVRRGFERLARRYDHPNKACSYQPIMIGDMKAEWIVARDKPDTNRVLLYFHGGGYAAGSINTHRAQVAQMVMHSGVKALMIDYRLAPENKFPAPVDDAVRAYEYLLRNNYMPECIALGGDSAGGGLTVATLLSLRDQGLAMPRCAICMSPWLDLTQSGQSQITNETKEVMLVKEALPLWAKQYLGDADPQSAYASPLFADLRGLPPVYIQVGSDEILLDDSLRFSERARAAGVTVHLDIFEGYFHVFQGFWMLLRKAREANKKLAEYLIQQLGT